MPLDALTQAALTLPPDERLELARQLLVSVDPEPDPGAAAAWEKEITRRLASFKSGDVKPIPAEDVFARLRHIAPNP
jgi:putative addiction module component (TIGR02574 family)